MKFGISVSNYCYNESSYNSAVKTVNSIIANSVLVKKLLIIDDCSPYSQIYDYYKTLKNNKKVAVHINEENLGIGKVKNQAIKKLQHHDVIILSDNDVEYLKGWDTFLFHCIYSADIKMVSLSDLWGTNGPKKVETRNGVTLHYYERLNGAFIAFTREVLEKVGGFPDLPTKYGQEHCNFQLRCGKVYGYYPYCIDIVGLKNYLLFKDCPSHLSPEEKRKCSYTNANVSNRILCMPTMYNDDYLRAKIT